LVSLQLFWHNSLTKCVAAQNCEKIHQKPLFCGFKVIDVDKSKQRITGACYDMQQVCTYLQPFSHCKPMVAKIRLFVGYPSLMVSFEGNTLTQLHKVLSLKSRVLGAAHSEDFVILTHTVLIRLNGMAHGQMVRRTDRRPGHG